VTLSIYHKNIKDHVGIGNDLMAGGYHISHPHFFSYTKTKIKKTKKV
jgi:hypothetical protein